MEVLVIAAFILLSSYVESIKNCQKEQMRFERIAGLRPSNKHSPLVLLQLQGSAGGSVTQKCIEKCTNNDECSSFVLFYKNSSCFWFKGEVPDGDGESLLDSDAAWFRKVCWKQSKPCSKLWTFERIPGATLIGNNTRQLPNLLRRNECQEHCLLEKSFQCRSAKFKILSGNDKEALGQCTLSNTDRNLSPSSYRVSSFDEEYFENQCVKGILNEFCVFEEYENLVLSHVDMRFDNATTKLDCQRKCDNLTIFNCRGYSVVPLSRTSITNQLFDCYLHSENSKLHGPKSLQEHPGAKYYERAPCLNITVSCTEKEMTIRFKPEVAFPGKLYMRGYSEDPQCYAHGNQTSLVTLRVPLREQICGILEARSPINRTLMSSTMVLQYNAVVQTQADRIIKVGCIFTNSTKVVVGAGINFTDDHTTSGTSLVNSSTFLPTVEMRIVDLNTHGEVSDTQIGDELQLVIEMRPADSGLDIWAGHLVAMTETGQDSILLLDDRGCPTNLDVFPGLTKQVTADSVVLTASFQAFKFSSSNVIRFSVTVQFCMNKCPSVDCGGGAIYNKFKRELGTDGSIKNINRTQFAEEGMRVIEKMPLEFIIIVRNANIKPDKLVYGENNRILVAGFDYMSNEVCIDFSLLIGIVITWMLIQIILLVSCIMLIRKYKKHYEDQCLSESLEELHKNFGLGFSNLDSARRVHFADGHLT